jgi:single-strand DNA-binding protein
MPRSVNRVTLLGHIGKDADQKFTSSGISVANFSVATSRKWKDKQSGEMKEETEWHRVVLWRNEGIVPYLKKGKPVYIEGHLQTRNYDKDGTKVYVTEIVADEVILLGGDKSDRSDRQPASMPRSAKPAEPPHAYAPPDGAGWGPSDDDVPFAPYDVPCV